MSTTRKHPGIVASALLLAVALGGAPGATFGQATFQIIDKHALKAPPEAEKSVAKLAVYLAGPARFAAEKPRAFYRWMADRIAFDPIPAKKPGDATPEQILETRRATAAGYVLLFQALCKEVGIETIPVQGHLRKQKAKPGDAIKTNHVWVASKTGKEWALVDPTLGAGAMNEQTQKWEKHFDPFFFYTRPDKFIFSHFPDSPAHQFLKDPVSSALFAKRLVVPHELVRYGAAPADIQAALDKPGFRGFVNVNCDRDTPLQIVKIPLEKHMKKEQYYDLRFYLPNYAGVKFTGINSDLLQNGGEYFVQIHPKKGTVVLSGFHKGKKWNVLEYEVED
jgi:hypothetical protein